MKQPVKLAAVIMRHLMADASEKEGNITPYKIDPEQMRSKAGLFMNHEGNLIRLAPKQNQLKIVGGPDLFAIDDKTYTVERPSINFMSQDSFRLKFLSDTVFELVTDRGGRSQYIKVQDKGIAPYNIEDLEGEYFSKDLNTTFFLKVVDNVLNVTLPQRSSKVMEFKFLDNSHLYFNQMQIQIYRDELGHIKGFYYSNPVLQKVYFKQK